MAGGKNPGPICQHTNAVHIDDGTLARHRSPAPLTIGLAHRVPICSAISIDTLVLDQDHVIGLLHSVAHAKVVERKTKLLWKDYNESTVINVIYKILPYGKPGTAEVDAGDPYEVLAETKLETDRLLEQFALAASQGAAKVTHFLGAQEQIRRNCLETVHYIYREATELNRAMGEEARRAVARLTLIKASSTIALKGAALVGGGLPSFLIGAGYDLTINLIKDWDKTPEAKLVGVTSKFAEKLAKKGVKDAAKNMAYILRAEESAPAHKAEWLEKRLAAMQEELEKQASAEKFRKFARDSRRLSRAQHEAARAKWGASTFSSVKFVFFAWDVYNATLDAHSSFEKAGYRSSWDAIKDAL